MKVEKKELGKSQVELMVELSTSEFKPYIEQGAVKVSRDVKISGFRPGKVPYRVLKQKIGEMTILEEAARIAIDKTIDSVIKNHVTGQPVGQPQVSVIKLAPDNPMEYKVVLAMLPEVTLGDYKNVKIKKKKVEVKSEEAEKMIEQLKEMQVKEVIADREARDGDKVIVDIQMFLDNVPIERGQSKDLAVIIGKDYIVPGFDKQLIRARKNEVKSFSLPYPANFHQKNLAGKLVNFKVVIKEIYKRQLPVLDDQFAHKLGFRNLSELRNNTKTSLLAEKEQREEQKVEIEMIEKIADKTKFGDVPELLVNHEAEIMIAELENSIVNQGGKFDDYLASLKKTRDQLALDLLPEAVKRVKGALLIREIALRENIKVSEQEVEKKAEELTGRYKGYKKIKQRIKEPSYKRYLQNVLVNRKVVEKLKEWNVEK